MTKVDPEIVELEARAKAAGVKMTHVLNGIGIAPTTWWRMRTGRVEPKLGTLRRIRAALESNLGDSDQSAAA